MSETTPADDGQATPAEAPAGTPTDSTGKPVPPPPVLPGDAGTVAAFEAAVAGDGETEAGVPDEVRKLRAEAAKWRTQLRDTEAVAAPFAKLNEDTRMALADVAEALAVNDRQTAANLLAGYASQLDPNALPAPERGADLDIQGMIDQAVDRALGTYRQETVREQQVATVADQIGKARTALGITARDDRDVAISAVAVGILKSGTIREAGPAYTEAYRRLYGEPPEGIESQDGPGGQTATLTPPASGEPAVQQRDAVTPANSRQRLREALQAAGYNTAPGVQ